MAMFSVIYGTYDGKTAVAESQKKHIFLVHEFLVKRPSIFHCTMPFGTEENSFSIFSRKHDAEGPRSIKVALEILRFYCN